MGMIFGARRVRLGLSRGMILVLQQKKGLGVFEEMLLGVCLVAGGLSG